MKEEDLKKKIEEEIGKIVPEGVELDVSKFDVKGFNEFVNTDTNNVVASKKDGYIAEGKASLLKSYDFENEDKLKAFISTANSDDNKLKIDLGKMEIERDDFKGKFNALELGVKTDKEISSLTSHKEGGFRAKEEYAAFNHSEISLIVKQAKESGKELKFKDAAKGYYEKNKQYVNPISTGARHRREGQKNTSAADRVKERLDEKYNRGKK